MEDNKDIAELYRGAEWCSDFYQTKIRINSC